jgi:hypothetical protein
MRRNSVELADDCQADIERLLGRNGLRLGEPQLSRLAWLGRRFGAPTLWESGAHPTADAGLVIVIDPPNGARADLLCRSLHAGSIVAIPFGENPGFDFLKSKLTDFGTIGACGIDYPHELWWGGLGWPVPKPDSASVEKAPRVVSCHPAGLGENFARRLKHSLERLGLDHDIEPIDAVFDDRMFGFEKADFVARMWERHGGPLLFVEADAVLQAPPLLPARLDCDFAAHRWNRWEMSARTIYFGNTAIAESLLRTWQDLSATYPSVWDGYLLDQAWSLTSSQMPLDTVWLPRSYHALTGDIDAHPPVTIVHDLPTTTFDLGPDPDFSDVARGARRAGRTGARDSLLVVNSPVPSESGVTVILRDIEASGARRVAASIEAVTDAFASDCGGFGRLELSLCPWKEDVRAAKEAARNANNRVIEIAPWQELSGDLFRSFARSPTAGHVRAITDRRG